MTGDWEPDPSDSLKTFGAFVQGLREHAGFTRDEFAPLVRFSTHTVASIELGRRMLDHMLGSTQLRNVVVQVMSLSSRHHACLDGPVRLVELPDGRRLGYCEGQQSGRLISDPKEVSLLYQRYATLRSQALTPADSESLLERMRGAL